MKKYFLVSSVISLVLLIVGGIGLLATGEAFKGITINSNGFMYRGDSVTLSKEIEVTAEAKRFDLDIPNTRLNIYSGDNEKIIINSSYYDEDEYIIKEEGSTIYIERRNHNSMNLFSFGDFGGVIEIIIPKELAAEYNVRATNGSIKIDNIKAKDIDIQTTNGDFNIQEIIAEENIRIDTTNGRISGGNLTAKEISFETTNGLVNNENLKADNINVKTSNGLIKAYECYSRDLTLRTTNGAITLKNENDKEYVIENLDVNTTNGKETVIANYKNRK